MKKKRISSLGKQQYYQKGGKYHPLKSFVRYHKTHPPYTPFEEAIHPFPKKILRKLRQMNFCKPLEDIVDRAIRQQLAPIMNQKIS